MNNSKKNLLLIFLIILPLFLITFILADYTEDLDLSNREVEDVQSLSWNSSIGKINSSEQLRQELLANEFISDIDRFLPKINIVFLVLFNQNYSFSLLFLLTILLWIGFLLSFSIILKGYSTFSPLVSFLLSICLAIIFAQLGVFNFLAEICTKLILGIYALFNSQRTLLTDIVSFIIFLVIFFLIVGFIGKFGKKLEKEKLKKKEKTDRIKLDQGAQVGEALTNAMKDVPT